MSIMCSMLTNLFFKKKKTPKSFDIFQTQRQVQDLWLYLAKNFMVFVETNYVFLKIKLFKEQTAG